MAKPRSGLPERPVCWRMVRPLALLGFAALAPLPPLWGQIGLTSATQSISLTAHKVGTVGVAVAVVADAEAAPIPVATTWNVDPFQVSTLSLVTYLDDPDPDGGAGPGRVLFIQPITPGNAVAGRRDAVELTRDWAGRPLRPQGVGTLNLLVITQ